MEQTVYPAGHFGFPAQDVWQRPERLSRTINDCTPVVRSAPEMAIPLPDGFRPLVKGAGRTTFPSAQFITLHTGSMTLSVSLLAALGSPDYVTVAISDNGEIAIIPSDRTHGYKVSVSHQCSIGLNRLQGTSFSTGRYVAEVRDEVAYVSAEKVVSIDTRHSFVTRRSA